MLKDNVASEKKTRLVLENTDSWLPVFVELLIFVTAFFSLRDTLNFLYADDDLVSSLFKGMYFFDGVTLNNFLQFLHGQLAQQISMGRIMIGAFPTTIPMIFFNLLQYRIYVLILICVNIWIFGKCVYQWTGSYKIKWFSMLLSPLFFQIHYNFHHPILSYYGLMQLLFIILFSSMYFFWKYCSENKKRWLTISCLLYLWGLLVYEVAYVFIPIFILLAYFATKDLKITARRSIVHIVLFGVFIIGNLIIKTGAAQNGYSGTTFNVNIPVTTLATIKQMVATIPLSNFIFNNWARYQTVVPELFRSITIEDILTVFLFLVALFLIHKTTETNSKIDKRTTFLLGVLGFMMVLMPSSLMGISARYQNEIRWGAGHIPVFIQYFGLIILVVAVYVAIREGVKRFDTKKNIIVSLNILLVVLSVFILLINQQYGRAQMDAYDSATYNNVLALQYALEDGAIQEISDDVVIINSQVVPTYLPTSEYSDYFFDYYSGKDLESVIYIDDFLGGIISENTAQGKLSGTIEYVPTKATYIVRTNRDSIEGVIYIGKIKNLTVDLDNKRITRCEIDELRIYAMNTVNSKYLSVYEKNDGQPYLQTYYQLEPSLLNIGANGRIYKFDFDHSVVDFFNAFLVYDTDYIDPSSYNVDIQPSRIDLAKPVAGNDQNDNKYFVSGWSGIEAWGRWSEGKQAILFLKLNEIPDNSLLVTFTTDIFAPSGKLNFLVLVNDKSVGAFIVPAGRQTFSVTIPKDNVIGNYDELKIVFDIKNPMSPLAAGIGDDPRKLGIGLVSFVITPFR